MLDKIRNDVAHNKVVKVLLVLITVAFVFWGMGLSGLSLNKNYAIKVGNLEVSATEYYRAYQQAKQQVISQFGGQEVSDDLLALFGIEQNVNQRFINQKTLELFANKHNLEIDAKSVFELIKQDPNFQDDNGEFNKDKYIALLTGAQMNPIDFEKNIMSRIQANLVATLFADVANVSDIELEKQVQFKQERRDVEMLTIKTTDLAPLPKPTTEELEEIYSNSIDEFKIAEKRDFKLLTVSKNELAKSVSVTDEEVKNYYEEHKNEFFSKQEYKVKQILVKDKKQADKILAIADLNENFTKYVEKYSKDEESKKTGGDMGWLTSDIFGADFETAMNTTNKNQVAKTAIKTLFGFHIFKVEDIKVSEEKSFDEVKDKIKATLKSEKAEVALEDAINKTLDMVSAGEKLNNIAKVLNVKLKEFNDIEATSALPYTTEVYNTALNEVSQPIELDFDSMGFVETTKIIPETTLSMDEVNDELTAKFNTTKTQEMLNNTANDVLEAIKEKGLTFKQAAKEFKLNSAIQSVVGVARSNNQKKQISNDVAQAVFDNELNSVVNRTIQVADDSILIVKTLDSYQAEISDKDKENIRKELATLKTDDLFTGFTKQIQNNNSVKINDTVIQSVIKQ